MRPLHWRQRGRAAPSMKLSMCATTLHACSPRYWRMVAEAVTTLGAGLEIATIAFPQVCVYECVAPHDL